MASRDKIFGFEFVTFVFNISVDEKQWNVALLTKKCCYGERSNFVELAHFFLNENEEVQLKTTQSLDLRHNKFKTKSSAT